MITDLENARATFRNAGLAFPAIPSDLASKLVAREKWLYSSKPIQTSPYNLAEYVQEADRDHLKDYVLLAHSGHGVNSFAIQYYLVHGPLRMFLHLGFGGVYSDAAKDTEQIKNCFALADEIVAATQKEGSFRTAERLLVVASDFYGSYCQPPGTSAEERASNRSSNALVTPERVLRVAREWLTG